MATLDKAAFLSSDSRKFDTVEVEALGGDVRLRELSTACRLKLADYEEKKDRNGLLAYALSESIVDDDGKRILTLAETKTFMGANGSTVDEIFQSIMSLNAMGNDAVEDAEKN